MSPNPYQMPPQGYGSPGDPGSPHGTPNRVRVTFVLAGIGSLLAALYWAGLTLLITIGSVVGSVSPVQIVLPCVLIGLYTYRGVQILKGDPGAAKRVLWLHGFGGVVAISQMATGGIFIILLQGVKLAIHIFGGVTAYLASRSAGG